jgi:hypothetical protein
MLAFACAALAGCGGSANPQAELASTPEPTPDAAVRVVIADEARALAAGRGADACDLMTPRGEEEAIAIVNQVAVERQIDLSFDDCAEAISAALGGAEPDPAALERAGELADAAQVSIDGANASVVLGAGEKDQSAPLPLERVDGQWRIADPDQLLSPALAAQPG